MNPMLAFNVALLVGLVATPVAAKTARRFGIVDRPGPLKLQHEAIPYLGGVAVFVAMSGPIAFARPSMLIPLALLMVLGLADDVGDLRPRLRLLLEIGIGLVAGGFVPAPGRAGFLITTAFVVGLVNAVNLLDGLDGLAGGVVAASAIGFAIIGGPVRVPALGFLGALGGFLWFNRPPARIYLGDSGAYLCGGALALFAALSLQSKAGTASWVTIPLLVALPVFDTAVAILRRRRSGLALFAGDRSHVYDQLVDRGQSRVQAVLECVAAQAVLTAIGVFAIHSSAVTAVLVSTVSVCVLAVIATWGGFLSRKEQTA